MDKHLTSNQQTSQLMYGFEESENIRRLEPTNHMEERGFFVRIILTDILGYADHEKFNYEMGSR